LYDDHSDGFSTEFDTRALPHNTLSGSFFFKDDTHKEAPWGPTSGPANTPLSDRQQTTSIGLQDVVPISSHLLATIGFSADHLNGLRAADSNNNNLAFPAPYCPTNTNNLDFTACTPHVWDYNPQASLSYSLGDQGKLFAAFAQKTRFPALKDLFSFKLKQALPNPELQPERSQNWSFGYSRAFGLRTVAQLELFRSNLHDAIESVNVPESTNECPNNSLSSAPAYVCSQNWNASKEVHQGVEFTVRSTPLPRLTLDASYTYLNKQISGYVYNGQPIVGGPCGGGFLAVDDGQLTTLPNTTCLTPTDLPKHKAMLGAVVRLPREAMLTSVLRYESGTMYQDSFSAHGNSYYEIVPMSNFATLDVGGSTPLYKGATLQLGVKNLLDRNYYYVLGYPEEGRNWYIGLHYTF